jgi:hypothetical protein
MRASQSSDDEGPEDHDKEDGQDSDGSQEGGRDYVEDQIAQEMQNWCE